MIALDLRYILEDAGHEVVGIANRPGDAPRLATTGLPVDVVIINIGFGRGPDGIDTARRLRRDYDLPTLFVSGCLTELNRWKAMQANPAGFIGKPFKARQILEALEQFQTG